MIFLLFLEIRGVFEYQGEVDTIRVRHEKKSIIASDSCGHAETVKVDRLEIDGVSLSTREYALETGLPHEIVLLVSGRGDGC